MQAGHVRDRSRGLGPRARGRPQAPGREPGRRRHDRVGGRQAHQAVRRPGPPARRPARRHDSAKASRATSAGSRATPPSRRRSPSSRAEELPPAARPVLAGRGGDGGVRTDVRRRAPPARRGRRRRSGDDGLGRDPTGRGRLITPRRPRRADAEDSVAFRNCDATNSRASTNRYSIITIATPERPVQIARPVEAVREVGRCRQTEEADARRRTARRRAGPPARAHPHAGATRAPHRDSDGRQDQSDEERDHRRARRGSRTPSA